MITLKRKLVLAVLWFKVKLNYCIVFVTTASYVVLICNYSVWDYNYFSIFILYKIYLLYYCRER